MGAAVASCPRTMGHRLPERQTDETDEGFAARRATSKQRRQTFKRIYRQYFAWQSLRETGDVDDVITIEGVDYYLGDLLTGLDVLPPQQRKAFELICLRGYTESAATKEILPNSKWSTPVQQYSDDALEKMISAYDAKQAGTWDPSVVKRRQTRKKPVATATKNTDLKQQHRWNWAETSEDHEALAEYINKITGLDVTASQVKAVSFLRKEWYHSPEAEATRQRRKEDREAEKAKFAYETPEQREARMAASRVLSKHQRAMDKANGLLEEMKKLRVEAGLDPETGEPVTQ